MTVHDLAKKAGLPYKKTAHYLKTMTEPEEKDKPKIEDILKIAEALKVPLEAPEAGIRDLLELKQ